MILGRSYLPEPHFYIWQIKIITHHARLKRLKGLKELIGKYAGKKHVNTKSCYDYIARALRQ